MFVEKYSVEELVIRLKNGDEVAYSYLYDHYGSMLFGAILQVIPERDIAAAVLLEVFIKIYEKINYYNSTEGRLYAWMLRITRNLAINKAQSKVYTAISKGPSFNSEVNTCAGLSRNLLNLGDIGF